MRTTPLIVAVIFSSGCGTIVQTIKGSTEEHTRRRMQTHRITVTADRPDATIERVDASGRTTLGVGRVQDVVRYDVIETVETGASMTPFILGSIANVPLLVAATHLAYREDTSLGWTMLGLYGASALITDIAGAVMLSSKEPTVTKQRIVDDGPIVTYSASIPNAARVTETARIPWQGRTLDLTLATGSPSPTAMVATKEGAPDASPFAAPTRRIQTSSTSGSRTYSKPRRAPPPPTRVVPGPQVRKRWYGAPIIAADAAAVALAIAGAATSSTEMLVASAVAFGLSGPIVHLLNGKPLNGLASLGLRTAGPALIGLVGSGVGVFIEAGRVFSGKDGVGAVGTAALISALVAAAGVGIADVVALAYEDVETTSERLRVSPYAVTHPELGSQFGLTVTY